MSQQADYGGVKVVDISSGKWKKSGIKKGFIIAYIDKVPVDNVEDLNRVLEYKKGGVLVEGFYADGEKGTYGVEMVSHRHCDSQRFGGIPACLCGHIDV